MDPGGAKARGSGLGSAALLHRMGKDQELPKAHVYRIHFHTKALLYENVCGNSVAINTLASIMNVLSKSNIE